MTHGVDAKERARAALAAAFDSIAPMFQRFEDELASKEHIIGSYSIADSTFTVPTSPGNSNLASAFQKYTLAFVLGWSA